MTEQNKPLENAARLLENDALSWIDRRRATKDLLRHELLLLKERLEHARQVEQARLDLTTEAELAQLKTRLAFDALRMQTTIHTVCNQLSMEVVAHLETCLIDYARQTTRFKRDIEQSQALAEPLKQRLRARTDQSFQHLLDTIEQIVDRVFSQQGPQRKENL